MLFWAHTPQINSIFRKKKLNRNISSITGYFFMCANKAKIIGLVIIINELDAVEIRSLNPQVISIK